MLARSHTVAFQGIEVLPIEVQETSKPFGPMSITPTDRGWGPPPTKVRAVSAPERRTFVRWGPPRAIRSAAFAIVALLPSPGRADPTSDGRELRAATLELAHLVADNFAEHVLADPANASAIGEPIPFVWGDASHPDDLRDGVLVPFTIIPVLSSYDAEYVAAFRRLSPSALAAGSAAGLATDKHFVLTDFAKVGGKMWRVVDWPKAAIQAHGVTVPTAPWRPQDPGCCATGKAALRITIDERGRLQFDDLPRAEETGPGMQ
jgi:hypothetical protein